MTFEKDILFEEEQIGLRFLMIVIMVRLEVHAKQGRTVITDPKYEEPWHVMQYTRTV